MPKKLHEIADESGENQLAAKVRESANQIWLAGLGAFAKAQEEGVKMFEALVAEGEKIQERTKAAADERLAEVREKATGAWDKLEQVFEDRVARALGHLGVYTSSDVKQLTERVNELSESVNALLKAQGVGRGASGAKAAKPRKRRVARKPGAPAK